MPRYIDADALAKRFNLDKAVKYGNQTAEQQEFSYSTMMMYEIADIIEDAPIADVQEVRHGRWIDKSGDYVCSVCGWEFSDELAYMARKRDAKTEEIMRYCMHCGAKMDRGEDNAEQQAETERVKNRR